MRDATIVRRIGKAMGLALALGAGTLVHAAEASSDGRQAFQARQAILADITQQLSMKSMSTAPAGDLVFAHDFDEGGEVPTNCTADTDADRLADCVETATGKFVSAQDTGTSPTSADSDGDGLLDGDEVLGTSAGLALPSFGVSPLRKDVLLEYDWFDVPNSECGSISHRPTPAVISRVSQMFASAPVSNPDGTTGINIIHDYGQGGATNGGNLVTGYSAVLPGTFDATYRDIKAANFDSKRLGYFHYVVMAHRYNGGSDSSGYAEVVGDDIIVTLYCANTEVNVGNTIAHELGHNLGLDHGGFEACNGKPNYNSIMNYRYQFAGVDTTCAATGAPNTANFSTGTRLALNENSVDEPQGVCGTSPIDWNANGQYESGLALDLNQGYGSTCGGSMTQLEDFDDWQNLTYAGVLDKAGVLETVQKEVGCAGAPVPSKK